MTELELRRELLVTKLALYEAQTRLLGYLFREAKQELDALNTTTSEEQK